MELITRNVLNPSLKITVDSTEYSYNTLIDYIDRAKTFLVKIKRVKKGQRALILTGNWPDFFVWFIAGSELGLKFVVVDSTAEEAKSNLRLYGRIDVLLSDLDEIQTYNDASHKDTVWAMPDSILIETLSSGSTGTPKVIKYTHKFLHNLAYRNSKLYDLKASDRCIHTKTLTHSSIVGVYFLPTLIACAEHYYFTGKRASWVKFIQDNKINKCAIFGKYLNEIQKTFNNDIDYNVTIFAVSRLPDNFKDKIVNDKVTVISIFGCSETSGPVLWSTITNENKSDYNDKNFGKQLDDFYKVDIVHGLLEITMPDGCKYTTGDKFHKDASENLIFDGKNNVYTINNESIDLDSLTAFIKKTVQQEFDLIVDSLYNSIYLRVDRKVDLNDLNTRIQSNFTKNYLITKQIDVSKDRLISGIKFNANAVRIKCRKQRV